MRKLLKRFCKWVLDSELTELYAKGVQDGVNQYHYDRDSALWMVEQEEEEDPCTCRDGEIDIYCRWCY